MLLCQRSKLGQLYPVDAEFRPSTARSHMRVVPPALTRIDTYEYLPPCKDLRMVAKRVEVVEVDDDTEVESMAVLVDRGKIRGEEDAARVDVRDGRANRVDFTRGYALKAEPFCGE